jgi:osmotically-inducible protein OsmY
MRSDSEIKRDVEDELRWDPRLDDTDVAVSVRDGVVELAGFVKSFPEKIEAEEAASRVKGVSGIANDIEVRRDYAMLCSICKPRMVFDGPEIGEKAPRRSLA